ncbi:MAG: lspA [Naasia sp.]|nr:lspA [Naasia sp.]
MAAPDPTPGGPVSESADGASVVPAPSARRGGSKVLLLLVLVAAAVYAADQLSKVWVVANLEEYEAVPVLGDVLQFVFVRNPGAAFSLASAYTWVFTIIAASVLVFLLWFARRIRSAGWAVLFGMLLGGTLGNLTDRLLREPGFGVGHVIDFLSLWMFPAIFNIADVAIVSSMGLFVILTLRGIGLDGSRTPAAPRRSRRADPDGAPDSAPNTTTDPS